MQVCPYMITPPSSSDSFVEPVVTTGFLTHTTETI